MIMRKSKGKEVTSLTKSNITSTEVEGYESVDLQYPLNIWLSDIADVSLTISGDINDEARSNLWSFSLSLAEARTLNVADIRLFLQETIEIMRAQLLKLNASQPMIFYCWFDAQSGTLRFSLISVGQSQKLPFRARISLVDDLQIICAQFLESEYLEGILWEELQLSPP